MPDPDQPSASYTVEDATPDAEQREAVDPVAPRHVPHDDLEGFETSMSKLADRMKGWMAVLLTAALVIPLGGWAIDELVFRRDARQVEDSAPAPVVDAVYLVRAVGCAGDVRTGSAFVVDVGEGPVVVTNRHVVEGTTSIGLRPLGGSTSIRATDLRLSDEADVAVLSLPGGATVPEPLTLAEPARPGDDVRVVGFPAALPFTTAGTVAASDGGRVLLDLQVDPGASGSPVVNADDEVVAQVYARASDGTGVATSSAVLGRAIVQAEPSAGC